MIRWEQIGANDSDCTEVFQLTLYKPYTVAEFIEIILDQECWGYVYVTNGSMSWNKTNEYLCCKYKQYEIITNQLSDDILSKRIKDIQAWGSYSAMDYLIKI